MTLAQTAGGGLFQNRNFLLWWFGAAQSALGSALAGIALSFLVLKQTGSAGAMGVNMALSLLPTLLSPVFGALIDRLPMRAPLVTGNVLRAVMQIGIGVAALRGAVPLELLHLLALMGGLIAAFYGPATMGVTSRLVPADQLQRASGMMQGSSQSMTLLGLVSGGLLVSRLGSGAALIFDGLTFAVFAKLLTLVHFPANTRPQERAGFWAEFAGGLSYAARRPVLWGLTVISLLINASLAPMEMLLPKRMLALGADAAGYGLFFGLLVAGVALGSLVLAWLGRRAPTQALSVSGLGGLGLCLLGLAFTGTPLQMYVVAVFMGLAEAATNVSLGVMFQTKVAPEFFGRVGSLLNMVGTAGMPLTLLALAPLADRLPISAIFAVAGAVTLLGGLAWAGLLRADKPVPLKAPISPT